MKKVNLTLLLMLVLTSSVQAADIRAFVDRTQIRIGESLNLTVTLSGGDADVDISTIRDFKVVSKGTSTSVRIVNSRMSRETSYNYVLVPLREGRLVIPPLHVVSSGKTFQTRAIIVQVSKQTAAVAGQSDMFVRATISEKNPYEGQQIIYTFKLFTTVRLANAKFQQPEFSGFTAKETGDAKSYRTVINGRQYTVSELSYMLMPLKPGKIVIKPGTFRCDVVRQKQGRNRSLFDSFFDDRFFGRTELEPEILTTESLAVNVRPLPAFSGNVNFSGLVGQFKLQAELEDHAISVGDSTTLMLTISGTGNIMDAVQPEIAIPDAFKSYGDNPEEKITVNQKGFSGKKVFRVALVAVKPGTYTIKPVKVSYFDVSQGKYLNLSTGDLSLTVNPSKEKETVQAFSAPAGRQPSVSKKKKVEFTGRDILPIKEDLDAIKSHKAISFSLFLILYIAPAILYLAVFTAVRLFRKKDDPGSIMVQRAENALKEASRAEISNEAFWACLYRALVSAIYSTAGIRGESLTYAEAEEILVGNRHPAEIGQQAAELLKRIESARYGGLNPTAEFKDDVLTETKTIVRRLLRK